MYAILDPDGDLLITLQPETDPFAEWLPAITSNPENRPKQQEAIPETSQPIIHEPQADIQTPHPNPSFLVLSKHMCLASPRFHKMMSGEWLEATTVDPDGRRHVSMEGFDLEAFTIVMQIIHAKCINVPRCDNVDTLGKIAIVVDDLQCFDAFNIWSDLWIQTLKEDFGRLSHAFDRKLIIWIFLSYVFYNNEVFKETTRIAILESDGSLPTLGLPIRNKITGNYSRFDTPEDIVNVRLRFYQPRARSPHRRVVCGPL
jgi:hypothetical protein